MLKQLVILLLITTCASVKQCNEKKPRKGVTLISKSAEQLTGKALVDHINKLGTWKAQYNKQFIRAKLNDLKRLAGVKPDIARVYANDPSVQSDFIPDFFSKISDSDIPKEFDSRTKWPECSNQINKIFDQSLCGSCWAVSSSTALADRFCIKSEGRVQVDLSVANLISCCTECGVGCVGGYPIKAYAYMQEEGIVSGTNYTNPEGCLPYPFPPCEHGNGDEKGNYPICYGRSYKPKACTKQCRKGFKREFEDDKYYALTSYTFKNDPKNIQKELMTNGPLVFTALRMYEDFLYYRQGVYEHKAGRYLGLHAVRVIGWGEENNTPYWLVANSWNTDWGADGYFKIKRGNNECGIETIADVGIPDLERSAHSSGFNGFANDLPDC